MGGSSTKALVLQKLLLVWTIVVATLSSFSDSKCDFEAIFNFGDSNSDTGGFWAAFPAQSGPFGMTYFKKPTGRASDGRLIVDFLGFKYGTKSCCGHGGGDYNYDRQVYCGNTKVINGSTVTATACDDPYNYVSWDGIHATEAANKLVTWAILNGSYFDPPFPLHQLCDLYPID